MAYSSAPLEQRFWAKVDKRGPDECWPWRGNINQKGYGRFWTGGKGHPAQRVAWELANGVPFPSGLFACHTCDNPTCVNAAHIWPGTHTENMADRRAKGRVRPRCPACNGSGFAKI